MEKIVSGEEYQRMKQQDIFPPSTSARTTKYKPIVGLVIVFVVVGVLGFLLGVNYEKSHKNSASAINTSLNSSGRGYGGYGSRYGNGQRPVIGQVTAISSTSISVDNSRSGTTSSYSISASTTITDDGQTVSASDIQTGDTVLIIVSGSGSSQASRILVNPSYGGNFSGSSTTTEPPASQD